MRTKRYTSSIFRPLLVERITLTSSTIWSSHHHLTTKTNQQVTPSTQDNPDTKITIPKKQMQK